MGTHIISLYHAGSAAFFCLEPLYFSCGDFILLTSASHTFGSKDVLHKIELYNGGGSRPTSCLKKAPHGIQLSKASWIYSGTLSNKNFGKLKVKFSFACMFFFFLCVLMGKAF